ncbi:MAG TPA: N-acetylglucosamine-6-phosphate deacetylase [Pseudonocardiaceae bacterium]|nr:N-acetylglucosamine-6-phosphate deacetylase [Pseudonocardiaceae bacterium]
MPNNRTTLVGARVVTPSGVLEPGWVTVDAGRISAAGTGPGDPATPVGQPRSAEAGGTVDLSGCWLVPGFVDMHCHGGGGAAYSDPDPARLATAVAAHRKHGTTTMMASLVARPVDELVEQVAALADQVEEGLFAGIHLEGPFISTVRCGAHDPAVLRPPDPESVKKLLAAGRGAIRMVTLAPELDGAIEAVGQFTDAGVVVGVGHTDAIEAQVLPAVEAGATVATHLFNAMRPLHHREPGPIGVLLDDERITVELICDLVHVHPRVARLAATHAGAGRTALVTDAMAAAGVGDGVYQIGQLRVTVRDGVPTVDGSGALAASTLTLDAALRNFVTGCGIDMADAVHAVATRPAQLLGRAGRTGVIAAGADADLVVLDAGLRVQRVMHRGAWI